MINMNQENLELYQKASKKWGNLQYIMVIEECSELIKAMTKYMRQGTHERGVQVFEEAADVEIMIEQIRSMSPESNALVDKFKAQKLERLKKLVEQTEN